MTRPRRAGVVMSASTIWPATSTSAAPIAGHEARRDEDREARRHAAEHVAGRGDETAQRERRTAPDDVGEPADGHRDEEAREPYTAMARPMADCVTPNARA